MSERQEAYFTGVREQSFEKLKEVVAKKGGKCLSDSYVGRDVKLKFQCDKRHIWKVELSSILNKRYWCPFCSTEKQRKNINDVIKLVESKGGKLLTTEYKNNKQKLEVICGQGHRWFTRYRNLTKYWCPNCSQSLSEKIFRHVLEKVFNNKFPSCRPKWLKGNKNYTLQIDGYNKELKFGFEYQGVQHFKFVRYFHKTQENFKRRKLNDKIKRDILYSRNIFMLYPTYKLEKENYFKYIKEKIQNTIYEKLANFDRKVDINGIYKVI